MGKRRSGRRRAAGDSSVRPSSSSGGSTDHQKSSSCKSTAFQPTRLSQQSGAAAAAEASSPPPPPRRSPTEDTPALRRRLVGLIRDFYIDAISRLPTADLRTTLARGLLVGGHCYGPLHPVDNIIANSVWYNAAFPLRPEDRVEVDVICTQGTDRAARRSLDGLVACLLHVCPFLSPTNALWQLVRSRADLRVAVASASAGSASVQCARPSSVLRSTEREVVKAAFQMAAEAAKHPNPAAFALFASSGLPDVSRLLASKRGLSSLDIRRLSSVLPHYPLANELSSCLPPPDPSPRISQYISTRKKGAIKWCNSLLQIVDAALCKFASKTGLHYELHTIYGDSLLTDEDFYDYYHINFMGLPKDDRSSSSGAEPVRALFFFAEAPRPGRHDFREEDISICCLVEPSPPDVDNCHACLVKKYKINHPSADPVDDTHDLRFGGHCYGTGAIDHDWSFRSTMIVDYLFFDSDRDNGLVEYLHNYFALVDANCSRLKDK
ncbi:uncharacterized protein LOC8074104 [Sorghum bicolor]|uniref:Uncharacterized protein n=1 Tax=Sorghum bicolor TaxID=4558 RepID=C5XIM5_SORBI|nr:uncharacterized protein LOC8074104 [Sorghum bicolor]EES02096.2 hypothetical protein SORBI_3003G436000 [Sorghum bicolor]|eukprot:XP_021311296.1 uncharacterized protein LOC8074104 [Sorghum bicolor]